MRIGLVNWRSGDPGTPAKLPKAAGVAAPAERAADFSERLAEIEQEKPADSKIAVATHQGALIFTPKRLDWTVARVIAVAMFLLYFPAGVRIWGAFVFEAVAHLLGTWATGDWAGVNLIGIAFVIPSLVFCGGLLAARSRLMYLFKRWQLIAVPENIVLRHSVMKFLTTADIEPKFAVVSSPIR
jgi:hypothetical protein